MSRIFTDVEYGSAEAALAAATDWRRGELEAAGIPDPPDRRIVLRARSASGIVGVHRREQRGVWVATFDTGDGARLSREFSDAEYGEEEARRCAEEQRRIWEREHLGQAMGDAPRISDEIKIRRS